MSEHAESIPPLRFDEDEWNRIRRSRPVSSTQQPPQSIPASGITRLDIPFWDVFCFALKFFVAQAIIAIPVVILWLVLLR